MNVLNLMRKEKKRYKKVIEFCVKNGSSISSICATVKEGKEICAGFAIAPLPIKVGYGVWPLQRKAISSVQYYSDVRDPLGALRYLFMDKWALPQGDHFQNSTEQGYGQLSQHQKTPVETAFNLL